MPGMQSGCKDVPRSCISNSVAFRPGPPPKPQSFWEAKLCATRWRGTLAGCRVTICEHLDGQVSIVYGPHVVGRYTAEGRSLEEVSGRTRKPGAGARRPAGALTP